ncbi:hypothetical protein C8F01DRAFT_1111027 [Mycena amicta]|nr:hypothetical protein C8F01DRAFT_1111027 [Mycena amicta]
MAQPVTTILSVNTFNFYLAAPSLASELQPATAANAFGDPSIGIRLFQRLIRSPAYAYIGCIFGLAGGWWTVANKLRKVFFTPQR